MANIEEIADRLFSFLIEVKPGDESGVQWTASKTLENQTGEDIALLNDAVDLLEARGLAKVNRNVAVITPPNFSVTATIQARAAHDPSIERDADKLLALVSAMSPDSSGTINAPGSAILGSSGLSILEINLAAELLEARALAAKIGTSPPLNFNLLRVSRPNGALPSNAVQNGLGSVARYSLVGNAQHRERAKVAINEAIGELQNIEGPGLEKDLVELFLVGQLREIIRVLDLETERVEEILAAKRDVNRALGLIERVIEVFRRYRMDAAVNVLSNLVTLLLTALATGSI